VATADEKSFPSPCTVSLPSTPGPFSSALSAAPDGSSGASMSKREKVYAALSVVDAESSGLLATDDIDDA
jgi:hypothetical protein